MLKTLASLFIALPLSAMPASAGEMKAVVELFTSQGCSSCPPADAELAKLIGDGDVLALSYHVDYWNYLGWKDTLSDPDNTARQKAYAAGWGNRSVYTPQAVINGRDHANGADDSAIRRMVDGFDAGGQGLTVPVSLRRKPDVIEIAIGPGSGKAEILVVYFDRSNTVKIKRGENSGRTITYRHSVRDLETVGMWSGRPQTIELPKAVLGKAPGRGVAVLLQRLTTGGAPAEILGAAMLEARPEG